MSESNVWDPKAVFRSKPEDCSVDFDMPEPIYTLKSGRRVTVVPLVDKRWGMRARLVRNDMAIVLQRFGLKFPSREAVLEINEQGHYIKPVTLSFGDEMRTFAHAADHDMQCWQQLAKTHWDGRKPVMNFGKWQVEGAAPGNNRLMGWRRPDGGWYQSGTGDNHFGEARSLHDYGTLCIGEVDVEDDDDLEEIPNTERQDMKFIQAKHFTKGRRPGPVDLIVIHTMEAAEKPTTAEAVASWFGGASAPRSSAHYCIDSDSVVQCVRDEDTAWHAPGANHNGIGLEHAGYAKQSAADWDDDYSRKMLQRSAHLAAGLMKKFDIPLKLVDAEGLKRGERGITTHASVSAAFKKSNHYDPGKNFPMISYMSMIAEELLHLGANS